MCIFGWSWLLLSYVPDSTGNVKPLAAADELLFFACDKVQREVQQKYPLLIGFGNPPLIPTHAQVLNRVESGGSTTITYGMPVPRYFRVVGHAVFALVAGVLGGLIGQWFYLRRRAAKDLHPTSSPRHTGQGK